MLQGLFAITWVVWIVLRRYIKAGPFNNVRGPKPASWLTGNLGLLFDRHRAWSFHQELSDAYGSVVRLGGLLGTEILYITDPGALRQMFSQESELYDFSSALLSTHNILFGPSVASVTGSNHRRQRRMLNPMFSVPNMRAMTPLLYKITYKLRESITSSITSTGRGDDTRDAVKVEDEVDVLHWMGRAALEFIGQCGFGHSFDPLLSSHNTNINNIIEYANDTSNKDISIADALKTIILVSFELPVWRMITPYLECLGPPRIRRMLADVACFVLPDKNLKRMRTLINTLDDMARKIFEAKREQVMETQVKGANIDTESSFITEAHDIMSILLKANMGSSSEDKLSDKELMAQISTFLFAGTDTTSSILARTLQCLALYPEWQDKLRQELADAHNYPGEEISYDELMALPLLDAICRETLRCYSPVSVVTREAAQDAVLPLYYPLVGRDGHLIKQIAVPKGTTLALNFATGGTDKRIWGEDAREWKPERWLKPLPQTVLDAQVPGVYSNMMVFGGGPRSCIGFRFSQLEMKIVLAVLVESFQFALTDKRIVWNWSGVSYPSMSEDSEGPSMILSVKRAE